MRLVKEASRGRERSLNDGDWITGSVGRGEARTERGRKASRVEKTRDVIVENPQMVDVCSKTLGFCERCDV